MEKKEILSELVKLQDALDKQNDERSKKGSIYSDSDITANMDYIPSKPKSEEPEKPHCPANYYDKNLTPIDTDSYEKFKSNNILKYNIFGFNEIFLKIITIVGAILFAYFTIKGIVCLSNGNADLNLWTTRTDIMNLSQVAPPYIQKAEGLIKEGKIRLIIGLCFGAVVGIIWLIHTYKNYVGKKRHNGVEMQAKYKKYVEGIKSKNIEIQKRKEACKPICEKYDKEYGIYEKNLKQYEKELKAYNEEWEKQKNIAIEKINKENEKIEKQAVNNFNKALSELSIDYPESYYYRISTIIKIIKDCRADNIKEAISVMLDDDHKEAMLNEQRELVQAQNEYNNALERKNREEEFRWRQEQADNKRRADEERWRVQKLEEEEKRRINSARNQCLSCQKPYTLGGCPMKGQITTICPNYIKRNSF